MGTFFTAQFTGGMNESTSPALLNEKTAALLVNANIESGKITSLKMPRKLSVNTPEALNHYGNINRSVIKVYERTYWSNNDTLSAPFYGGDKENYLGIPYPDYNKDVNITAEADGVLDGDYKYCVTFVNENGWEGAPGAVLSYEKSITLSNQNAKITVSWEDERVSYAKVYRTQKEGADFFCIGEIKKSGGSFVDNTDDYSLVSLEALSSIDNYPPPDRGKYLCESGNVFFLAVDSTLYFSAVGNPHAWPKLNFIGFDDLITGIVPEFQGVLVFTANNTYRITGADNINTLIKTVLPGNQGCVIYNSIAQISNAPIWLSNDGICLWNGESINVISRRIMNTVRLQVNCAVSANDCYYLFLQNGAIIYDHRNGDIFSKLDFTCKYAWYDGDADALYLQKNDGIFLFGGGEQGTYIYKSGYIGLPESEYTFFKEVIITIDGTANVTLSNEDNAVFSVALKRSGKYRLKAPYNTLGRYAQIKIVGKGTLKEAGCVFA
jgi:hypothetical protein